MADFVAHVALGEGRTSVGQLRFTHAGPRQFSTFAYSPEWIENPRAFASKGERCCETDTLTSSG